MKCILNEKTGVPAILCFFLPT